VIVPVLGQVEPHFAEYVPPVVTVMFGPVEPSDQVIVDAQPVAVKTADTELHVVLKTDVITGGTIGLGTGRAILIEAGLLGHEPMAHVAVYSPSLVTVIELPVSPVDQVIVPVHPATVSNALEDSQPVVTLEVIVGDGLTTTVTVLMLDGALTQDPFVHVAE
jgi:hypothetical protein